MPKSKRCTKCGELKTLKLFSPNKHCKDGRNSHCHSCNNKAVKLWVAANPAKKIAIDKQWYSTNSERTAARVKEWFAMNPGRHAAYTQAYNAAKLQAIPPWLTEMDMKKIEEIYKKAAELGLTVDHEIPLQGKGICGLHVPWNLQLLSRSANSSKGNKFKHDIPIKPVGKSKSPMFSRTN